MSNEDKKKELAQRVLAPQKKTELAQKVQGTINRSKKAELAARMKSIAGETVTAAVEESCACNVHFSVDPNFPNWDENGNLLTHNESTGAHYDWPALIAAGVDPAKMTSVESQVYQLVNRGVLRASAALDLLGFEDF